MFSDPYCTVVNGRSGQLLNARIASDQQWRFAPSDSVPERFAKALITYEDRRFYSHFGVDIRAVARAIRQNLAAGGKKSGASTLSMQLMRMSRKKASRSPWQKLIETAWALRAEWRYSKDDLMRMYASHAPFGGNVVGLEAASWRYYHKPAHALTWSESAVLAVLPNAPGLIYPGRNPDGLRQKRNALLKRLHETGHIDKETYKLSLLEEIPGPTMALPDLAPHFTDHLIQQNLGGRSLATTINANLQEEVQRVLNRYITTLSRNHIHNGAVLVADIASGEVLVYCGNTTERGNEHGEQNNMITAPRSSGSILKPFLYAQMVQNRQLTPWQILPDIPTQIGGFAPRNFDEQYSGAVKADAALAASLNIPAVRMLREYSVPAFHNDLRKLGFSTVTQGPGHYGLSLILGGAETKLWDLVNAYREIPLALTRDENINTDEGIHLLDDDIQTSRPQWNLQAGVAWSVSEALSTVKRPVSDANWLTFSSSRKISWKTGTSLGLRDAWAVGYDGGFVVGIWVGNASGEGRPGLTGLQAAAPLLFEVFNKLPHKAPLPKPRQFLQEGDVCAQSGMRAGRHCAKVEKKDLPLPSLETAACKFCLPVQLDASGRYRVHKLCYESSAARDELRFVLPPLQEWYYRRNHPDYQGLPPWMPGCDEGSPGIVMQLIYPTTAARIIVPREVDGNLESIVLKAAHRSTDAVIYWHLNDQYLGLTSGLHHLEIRPEPGNYDLTLVDDKGAVVNDKLQVVAGSRPES